VQSVQCFQSRVVSLSLVFCFPRPDRYALVKGNITDRGESWRGRAATRLSNTGKASAHNASLAPWLTLKHCQGDTSSPFSRPFLGFCEESISPRGHSREIVESHVGSVDRRPTMGSFAFSFSLSHCLALLLFGSLTLSRVMSYRVVSMGSLSHRPICSAHAHSHPYTHPLSLSLARSLFRTLALLLFVSTIRVLARCVGR